MVKKLLLIFLISSVFYRNVEAQQPTQYTMYMFNPLHYNPAIAGKDDAINIVIENNHKVIPKPEPEIA